MCTTHPSINHSFINTHALYFSLSLSLSNPMASVSASSLGFHPPPMPMPMPMPMPKPHFTINHMTAAPFLKSSFFSPLPNINPGLSKRRRRSSAVAPRFSMRVAASKQQAYICRDCGYIYNDRTPFDKLPDKYFCPVCGAPKRRFRAYEQSVSKKDNEFDVRKARKAQIQKDEAIGKLLPIGAAVGVVALVGLYLYLNSVF